METKPEKELTQLEDICIECLTVKHANLEHCNSCNKCVRNFHFHSKTFNKCFGDRNIRCYILYQFFTVIYTFVLLYLVWSKYWKECTVEYSILKPIQIHQLMPYGVLIPAAVLEFYTLHMLDNCIHAMSSILANMTLNQYSNVQNYKYLFEPQLVKYRL